MKILIFGGTGILSTDFTQLLLNQKNDVYLINRGHKKEFIDSRCHLIISDIRKEKVEKIKDKILNIKFDVVVDFLSYNVEQLKKNLKIIDKQYVQYIFISSATVYKENSNPIKEESLKGNLKWSYAFDKYKCEEYLLNSNINYTIIRPYVTYGKSRIPFPIIPDGFHYTLLARILQEKPVLLFNDGKAICTLTNTKDFALVLSKLLLNKKAYKNDFNIVSEYNQSWKDVYILLCKILNKVPQYVSVNLLEIHKYFPEFENALLGDKGRNMIFNNDKIKQITDNNLFKIDLEKGLTESINFYLNNDFMKNIDYKWDGRCDYILKKKGFTNLKPLNGKNNNNNNNGKVYYYIMSNNFLRNSYDYFKKIKNERKKENEKK